MCGLCGVMTGGSKLTSFEVRVFEQLLLLNALRGSYGVGVTMVPADVKRAVKVVKGETTVLDGDFQIELARAVKKEPMMLLGHTRSPTSGGWGIKYAHPFRYGKIIGMHNGTMEHIKGRKPDQKVEKGADPVTDSQMLYEAISERGPEEVITGSRGAYALTWLNLGNDTFNVLRNNDRPLNFATHESFKGALFWSSEALALEYVFRRSSNKGPTVYRVPTDKLISYKLRNGSLTPSWQGELKSLPPDPAPQVSLHPHPPLPIGGNCVAAPDAEGKIVWYFRTYQSHAVEEELLKLILASGCNWCGTSSDWNKYKAGELHWIGKEEWMCADCVKYDQSARVIASTANATKH